MKRQVKVLTICGPINYNPVEGIETIRRYHLYLRSEWKDCKILSPWRTLCEHKWDKKAVWAEENHRKELVQLALQNILVSDILVFLPTWRKSYGCTLEYAVGVALNIWPMYEMSEDFHVCELNPKYHPNPIKLIYED